MRARRTARFEIGIFVAVLEECLLLDEAQQVARHGPWPDPRDLRLPQFPQQALAAEHVSLVRNAEPGVKEKRGRLHSAGWSLVSGVQRRDPSLCGCSALAAQPPRRAGKLEHRGAFLRTFRFFEDARRLGEAAQLEQGKSPPQRMLVVGQLVEPACLQ